jgi:hypothetical protein
MTKSIRIAALLFVALAATAALAQSDAQILPAFSPTPGSRTGTTMLPTPPSSAGNSRPPGPALA